MLSLENKSRAWARNFSRLILLLGLVSQSLLRAAELAAVGSAIPELAAYGLEGTQPDLKGKVVLLDFWASWCGPCKRSFPVMKELQEKFGPRGFQVVAVSVDEKKSDADGFVKKTQPTFPILRDGKGKLAEAMGVQTMPTSFVVSPEGKILAVHNGFEGEPSRKEYLKQIESALKTAGK